MKTSSSSLSISVSVLLIFFSVLTASTEGGTRRVLNSTKTGIAGRGMHGRFDRDYYDDILADINGDGDPPIPIIHVSGGKKDSNVKETAAAASTNNEGKDKEAEPRICKDASVTLPTIPSFPSLSSLSSLFDPTGLLSSFSGANGVGDGIAISAIIIAILKIKAIVIAFIIWAAYATGFDFGGSKGSGDQGYGYSGGSPSTAYGTPIQQSSTYGYGGGSSSAFGAPAVSKQGNSFSFEGPTSAYGTQEAQQQQQQESAGYRAPQWASYAPPAQTQTLTQAQSQYGEPASTSSFSSRSRSLKENGNLERIGRFIWKAIEVYSALNEPKH